MDKRTLYDGLGQLQEILETTLVDVSLMKDSIQHVIERNTTLEIENQRLRDRLQEVEDENNHKQKKAVKGNVKKELSQARLNLEKLYEDGFHVCNEFYGQRRDNDEECFFCINVIDRLD
ncbi:MAG: DNA replication initiation control protein YabA [Lactobacillales bacterium]|nr:DNA replication initiation control protein YabA [Lactobacillales bacterium]